MPLPKLRYFLPFLIVGILIAAGIAWYAISTQNERKLRADLAQVETDLDAGRLAVVAPKINELAAKHPDNSEIAFFLGRFAQEQGRAAEAFAAFERVRSDSSRHNEAIARRAEILQASGRFRPAEDLVLPLPRDDSPASVRARATLELVYRFQVRGYDVRPLIIETWAKAPDPSLVLRRLDVLQHAAFPLGVVGDALAKADPNDDRVLLAKANVAILGGKLDEAYEYLKQSNAKHEPDLAVHRTELELAVATGSLFNAWEAMALIPAHGFTQVEQLRLRAWLAKASLDPKREQAALIALSEQFPGVVSSWDRLAELAILAGDKAKAETYRKRKAAINHTAAEFKRLIDRDDRVQHAAELADLASQLGRDVEARGWGLIRDQKTGEPLELSLATSSSSQTLAELFKSERVDGKGPVARPYQFTGVLPTFDDQAERSGLKFVYDNGHSRKAPPPPEAMGGGVGLIDYDGDGWLDVYLVQGGPFPIGQLPGQDGDRLFRNKHDGTFEDVSEKSGIAGLSRGYGHGVTVGDFDNDGRPDLFITRWRSYALYHNRGDGTFEDVTTKAKLGGDRDWPTSAAFADLDNDGDLDLYVCHYLAYDENNPKRCNHAEATSRHDCSPVDFDPLPDHVFRNDGGVFVDVTEAAGMSEKSGRGLGVVAADLDNDGKIDIYVANDMSANFLYRNLGGFKFEEVGLRSGSAASADGGFKAGMGLACGDLDGDGLPDLGVTNYYGESTTFYRNLGNGMFADHTDAIGLSAPSRLFLGFGLSFLDVDNDGRLDILTANGHVLDGRPRYPWMMPLLLFRNIGEGRVRDVSSTAGPAFVVPHLGRGFAGGDLDHDGKLDAVVVCQNEPVVYLKNTTNLPNDRHFVVLSLAGTTSNRDAVGAKVTVRSGSKTWTSWRTGGGNYQSAGDPRLHFGLGQAAMIDEVTVLWPSGKSTRYTNLPIDTGHRLVEGQTPSQPLLGWTNKNP